MLHAKEESFISRVFEEFGFDRNEGKTTNKTASDETNVASIDETIRKMAATMKNQRKQQVMEAETIRNMAATIERMQHTMEVAAQRQEGNLQRLQDEIASLKQTGGRA
jgi:hypothetical protein